MASRSSKLSGVWGCGVLDVFEAAKPGEVEVKIEMEWGALVDRFGWPQVPCSGSTCNFPQLRLDRTRLWTEGVKTTDLLLVSTPRFNTGLFYFTSDPVMSNLEAHMGRLKLFSWTLEGSGRDLEALCRTSTKMQVSTVLTQRQRRP